MTLPVTIDDITSVDPKARTVTHTPSGLQLGWPEIPPDKFSTLFRLVFREKGLEFNLRWELKKSEAGETLICQPEIKDGIERKAEEDPITVLVEEVYACLWAYAKQVEPDVSRTFAMIYNDNIYTGNIRIPMNETKDLNK